MIAALLALTAAAHADRTYTHVLTVGTDPETYDYTTINDAIVNMPALSETELGCIEIYAGTYVEQLNSYYTGAYDLPAHCDLKGMGTERDDVVIQHWSDYPWAGPYTGINKTGVNCLGDNQISHLKVLNQRPEGESTGWVQNSVEFQGDGKLLDCDIVSKHAALHGRAELTVDDCSISALFVSCIHVYGPFSVTDSQLYPNAFPTNLEWPTGIIAEASGIVDNVSITASNVADRTEGNSSTMGVWGFKLKLDSGELVKIRNSEVSLSLRTENHKDSSVVHLQGVHATGGQTLIEDCNMVLTAFEDPGNPADPNDDGAGIQVDGIELVGGAICDIVGATSISTSRTTAGCAADGYEYQLNAPEGTLGFDITTVTFDPYGSDEHDPAYVAPGTNIENARVKLYSDETCQTLLDDYFDISNAVSDAVSGNEIVVRPGTYIGPNNRDIDFDGKAITLRSWDPYDWEVVASTIIDCQATATDQHRAFYFHSAEDPNSVVTGLAITNGYAPTQNGYSSGGGMFCTGSGADPTIANCVFYNNGALDEDVDGGAIACYNGASPKIKNCIIRDNSAQYSGAITCWSSTPEITNCLIYENTAEWGGAIYFWQGTGAKIVNCTIADNVATLGAGAIFHDDFTARITNTVIWGTQLKFGSSAPVFSYSDVRYSNGSGPSWDSDIGIDGGGNIDDNPLFIDSENGDYGIDLNSPCVDVSDPNGVYAGQTDIDAEPRRMHKDGSTDNNPIVDIGADETWGPVHNLSQATTYFTIVDAIDDANDNDIIELHEGTYSEVVDFAGKSFTLRSHDPSDDAVVAATTIGGVDFISGETSEAMLSGISINAYRRVGKIIQCVNSNPTIERCVLSGSSGSRYGVYCNNSSPTIRRCSIHSTGWAGISISGYSYPEIVNNCIYENFIGVAVSSPSIPVIRNNTIADNTIYGASSASLSNCIVWGNGTGLSNCTSIYSCGQVDPNSTGNISSDPNFVDAPNDDYHLDSTSPCIDVGDPSGDYTGQTDIDGDNRVIDVSGKGNGTVDVDMGSDEYDPD